MNRQDRRRIERQNRRNEEASPLHRFRVESGGTVTPSGIVQFVREVPDRLEEFDKPGRHMWTISSVYHVANPDSAIHDGDFHMDRENLILVAGVGCFKCEKIYSPTVNLETCKGSISG